ncbi:hypothetical protein BDZ97DRAFT_1830019 [Flammula alnicola]|nr:hypothetical protein BDZ97DRAFT_1830019 [Flammula alnicola]
MQILMQNGSGIAIQYITEQEVMQNLYNISTKSSPPPAQKHQFDELIHQWNKSSSMHPRANSSAIGPDGQLIH